MLRKAVAVSAVAVLASACGSAEPEEESEPQQAASESPSESESPEASTESTDPQSARLICDQLRLRDSYEGSDDPVEAADAATVEMEAVTDAMEDDAEPALREIAEEHAGDSGAAADAMAEWCKENTEPVTDGEPW